MARRGGRFPASSQRLMRFLLKTLTHIPLPILYGFGFIAYCIVFHLMRWRRDRAEADIANAFPEKSPQERADIVRRCYRNLADTIVEAFWGFGASANALKARVKFEDAELIRRAIDRRQTILLLAAHHGNWE